MATTIEDLNFFLILILFKLKQPHVARSRSIGQQSSNMS